MTRADYLVLGALSEFSRGGARPSQRDLADFAGLEVMYVSKLVRSLEHSGLLRRADHPDDTRAFQLELTARGAGLIAETAVVMRDLFDQLLRPIGGRSGKRHVALVRTLGALLDEAQAFNLGKGPQTPAVRQFEGRRRR